MPAPAPQAKRYMPYHNSRYVYARSEGVSSVRSTGELSDRSQGMSRALAATVWPEGEAIGGTTGVTLRNTRRDNPQTYGLAKAKAQAKAEAAQREASGLSVTRTIHDPSTHRPADVGFPRYTGWTPVLNPQRREQPLTPPKAPPGAGATAPAASGSSTGWWSPEEWQRHRDSWQGWQDWTGSRSSRWWDRR